MLCRPRGPKVGHLFGAHPGHLFEAWFGWTADDSSTPSRRAGGDRALPTAAGCTPGDRQCRTFGPVASVLPPARGNHSSHDCTTNHLEGSTRGSQPRHNRARRSGSDAALPTSADRSGGARRCASDHRSARLARAGRRPREFVLVSLGSVPPRAVGLAQMARQIESSRSRPPILRRAVAALVLVAVGVLVFHFVVSLVITVFWIVAVIAVIVAVLWAVRELF